MGVRNGFEARASYFVKVKECPESVLFGPFPSEGRGGGLLRDRANLTNAKGKLY